MKTPLNILLVDDDELLAKGTAKLIQRLGGHHVCIADEPAEILRLCAVGAVDLVMMDVNLPGAQWDGQEISGTDISRLLKNQPETAHIPVILVTAYAMLTERQCLMSHAQADEFYMKPITDYNALLATVDRLYHRARSRVELGN